MYRFCLKPHRFPRNRYYGATLLHYKYSNKSNSVPLRLQFITLLDDTEDPFNLSRRPWLASNNQETLPWKRMYKKPYGTDNLGTYERLVCAVFKAYVLGKASTKGGGNGVKKPLKYSIHRA
ncbi:hypothetical protein CDAR_204621 [Caerostris darwini]|uniref:LAGLIDADG homing endonuclease n=1 Tax=Caerostris darwini TaxID=1538125 RepID=A0AAV4MR06_9ARAC|nr:hypothetical protein CDAR_204621 [Caerostris darwini]